MPNIPGAFNQIPGCDPVIKMTYGTPEGRLFTDDWGGEFRLEGNIRLAALAVLESALMSKKSLGCYGISFSKFSFKFENGTIEIEPRWEDEDDLLVLQFIDEMRKLFDLKVFL